MSRPSFSFFSSSVNSLSSLSCGSRSCSCASSHSARSLSIASASAAIGSTSRCPSSFRSLSPSELGVSPGSVSMLPLRGSPLSRGRLAISAHVLLPSRYPSTMRFTVSRVRVIFCFCASCIIETISFCSSSVWDARGSTALMPTCSARTMSHTVRITRFMVLKRSACCTEIPNRFATSSRIFPAKPLSFKYCSCILYRLQKSKGSLALSLWLLASKV